MLTKLAQKFAEDNGLTLDIMDNGHGATIHAGPLDVRLVLQPGSSMLVAQTCVGVLPDKGREQFLMRVLSANDLFAGSNGMTLGVNAEAEVVTLQICWDISALSQESFSNLIVNLVSQSGYWLEKLSEPQNQPSQGSQEKKTLNDSNWVKI
ncbi:MAG: type III secretion system chaperone [Desulfovibrio sp.]|nr:type III secretion system chaperone [Desulfovibrio sp.]